MKTLYAKVYKSGDIYELKEENNLLYFYFNGVLSGVTGVASICHQFKKQEEDELRKLRNER